MKALDSSRDAALCTIAKKRVAVRVQRGGHDIPAADIERRYWQGLRNFFELYRELANT